MGDQTTPSTTTSNGQTVLAISGDGMGRGDDELGRVLLRSHLHVLTETVSKPDVLVFFNTGVTLAAAGCPTVDDLLSLAESGVQILLCGTCVNHFELKDKLAVGEVSNMYAITETMLAAGKVINL